MSVEHERIIYIIYVIMDNPFYRFSQYSGDLFENCISNKKFRRTP